MEILVWILKIVICYFTLGTIYLISISLYYKLTNRYTGGGMNPFSPLETIVLGLIFWPIAAINTYKDWKGRK